MVAPRTRYLYDADGNLTGIVKAPQGQVDPGDHLGRRRSDAARRRYGSTTDYTYDDTGQRAIERGPNGETAFVNPWVTVRNGNEICKHVWAGDDDASADPARRRRVSRR